MGRKVEITEKQDGDRILYGMRITENGCISCFSELTTNTVRIEQLKMRLQKSDISAVHIADIIRDFITEEACDKLLINSLL